MNDLTPPFPLMPIRYTPEDWYWAIGGSTTEVWSSKRAMSVPVTDQKYLDRGMAPSPIASMDELDDMLRTQYPAGSLNAYNADARWRKSNGGIVCNGTPFSSDTLTMGALNSAYIYTQQKANATFEWKLADGSFVTLNKTQIAALQSAQNDFDTACYTCESDNGDKIDAGTITTLAQIDDAYAAISNVFTGLTMDELKVRKRRKR